MPSNLAPRDPVVRSAATTRQQQPTASPFPLMLGIVAFIASVGLSIWTVSTAVAQPVIFGLLLPLASDSTWPLSVAGYLLTPLTVSAALGWDRISQQRGLRDRNFALKPRYQRVLRWCAGLSFILAVWHVLNIAAWAAG